MDIINHKNGFVKKELSLLRAFIKESCREFTFAEIKKISKNKSYHYVYDTLKKFTEKGILKAVKKGNTTLYSLNSDSNDFTYLNLVESLIRDERKDLPLNVINQIRAKIKDSFYILLICGSYAEGKQKSSSDLDLLIIIPNNKQKKKYEIALKEGELTVPQVHGYVFSEEEFYLMLINKEFNYGKECSRKHIVIYGGELYYKILFEAVKNGFKG
jgi:predicted nucleotidyltransferase